MTIFFQRKGLITWVGLVQFLADATAWAKLKMCRVKTKKNSIFQRREGLSQYPCTHLHILSTLKAAWKCTGFFHCTSFQHVECLLRCCLARCSNVRRFHKGSCLIMAENLWIRWALRVRGLNMLSLPVQVHSTLLSHAWMIAKQRKCWAKSLTSFKFDSTRFNTSQQGVQMRSTCWAQHVESLCCGQIQCIGTQLKEWDLARLKISPLYANKWQEFWNLAQ